MADILNYPDNLILHLERDRRSYKVFTTDKTNTFKVINGLWSGDGVIDTSFINLRQLEQLLVDSCINGYEIKSNLIFREGLYGVAKRLAKEREREEKERIEMEKEDVVSAVIVSDSEDEKVNVTFHNSEEEEYEYDKDDLKYLDEVEETDEKYF